MLGLFYRKAQLLPVDEMATSFPSFHPSSVTNIISDKVKNVYTFEGVDPITFVLVSAILFFAICCFSAIGYLWYTKIFLKERALEENELAVMGDGNVDTVVSPMRAQRPTAANKLEKKAPKAKPRASGFGFGDVFQGGDSIPMKL